MGVSDLLVYSGCALMVFSIITVAVRTIAASKKGANVYKGVVVNKRVGNDVSGEIVYYITFNINDKNIELRASIDMYNAVNIGYLAEVIYDGDVLVAIK